VGKKEERGKRLLFYGGGRGPVASRLFEGKAIVYL
jgi:hypothetical protein